jgi:hypothetical protein
MLVSISATPEVRHLAEMLAEEPRGQGTSFVDNFISARQAQSLVFLHTIGSFISSRVHSQAFGLLLIYTTMLFSCEAVASSPTPMRYQENYATILQFVNSCPNSILLD